MNSSNSGAGSLRQAVIDACVGSTITFAGSVASPILLSGGEITINKDLVIQGPGAALLTISGNNSSRIFNISGAADVTLAGLTIANGRSTAFGGGITITSSGTVNLIDTTVSGSVATRGGGINAFSAGGALNVTGSTIAGNSCAEQGGGIYYRSTGKLTITDSTFSGNTATGSNTQGGGLFIEDADGGGGSKADITNSTFSGNSAISSANFYGLGGGITYSSEGVFTISNSTIVGNSSSGRLGGGGGVDITNANGALTVTNTTITGNTASGDPTDSRTVAGGIKGANVTLRNSIVALNTFGTGPAGSGPDVTGPFTSQGYNLIGIADGSTSFNAPGDQAGTAASPLDPRLAPLADNGGPTLTETPLPGSPAIDGGDPAYAPPPAFDQRGFVRVFSGRIDIGAVEFASVETKPATSLGAGTATLNGLAYRSDLPADVQFRIGTDPTLAAGTDLAVQSIGAGSGPVAVNQAMSGLVPDTTYYFQLILTNASGRYEGQILSFILGASISVEQLVGNVLADGATVNFSYVAEHTTFIIRNTGGFPLTNLAISVDGAHPGDYSVSALGVTTVAPGARITFSVSFTPGAIGARSAAMHIASNVAGPTNPFDIALTGTGRFIWTGPPITFTNRGGSVDRLTSRVWLTRDSCGGLLNVASNPDGLEWAVGTTASLGSLTFSPYLANDGHSIKPPIGPNLVLHLISENIYLDIRFTSWTDGCNDGGFSYVRSTPGVTNQSPVARCKNVTVSAAANSCSANASINNGSSDPDLGDTITLTQSPPGPYPLGDTTVTLTVTDNHGASSSCAAVVTVKDVTPPVITCPANITINNDPGQCFGTVAFPASMVLQYNPTGSQITSSPLSPVSPVSGFSGTSLSQVGLEGWTNTNVWPVGRITSSPGIALGSYLTFGVTVPSGTDLARLQYSKRSYLGQGATSASVRSSLDGFASDISVISVNPGSDQELTFDLTSLPFISGPVTFRIYFWGAPVNLADWDDLRSTAAGGNGLRLFANSLASASDTCSSASVSYTNFASNYQYSVGTTTVTATAIDASGNPASCSFTVTVVDNTAPVPNAASLSDVTGQCSANLPAAPTATDACDGAITGVADLTGPFSEGDYTITWTFEDSKHNKSTQTQLVKVHDTTPPSITCPANISVVDNVPGSCGASVNPGAPTTSDNCGVKSVAGVRSDGKPLTDLYPVGTTTITWTVTDNVGNTTSCEQTVTVTNPAPTVTITGPVTPQAVNTPVNFTATFTDNAGDTHTAVWTFDGNPQAGTVNEGLHTVTTTYTFTTVGPHAVTLTVTDDCGQRATASTSVLIYAYATGTGSFVIGDRNAGVGTQVTFWGAQWWKLNSLSGGTPPASFKGFANRTSTTPPNCGGIWTTDPGNSSNPPGSIPAYLAVFVSSSITQSGSTISGNIRQMVVVKTNAGYKANPGHAGTGMVIAVICSSGP